VMLWSFLAYFIRDIASSGWDQLISEISAFSTLPHQWQNLQEASCSLVQGSFNVKRIAVLLKETETNRQSSRQNGGSLAESSSEASSVHGTPQLAPSAPASNFSGNKSSASTLLTSTRTGKLKVTSRSPLNTYENNMSINNIKSKRNGTSKMAGKLEGRTAEDSVGGMKRHERGSILDRLRSNLHAIQAGLDAAGVAAAAVPNRMMKETFSVLQTSRSESNNLAYIWLMVVVLCFLVAMLPAAVLMIIRVLDPKPREEQIHLIARASTPTARISTRSVGELTSHSSEFSDSPHARVTAPRHTSTDSNMAGTSIDQLMCPDLVVPPGSECTVTLPWLASGLETAIGGTGLNMHSHLGLRIQLMVKDHREEPLFKVDVKYIVPGDVDTYREIAHKVNLESEPDCRLALSSAFGGPSFACATDGKVTGSRVDTLALYNADSMLCFELFSENNTRRSNYRVSNESGRGLHVCRRLACGRCDILNHGGWPVATVLPGPMSGGKGMVRRTVRIGQQADAGLIVLVLLGIDLLELARA